MSLGCNGNRSALKTVGNILPQDGDGEVKEGKENM